MQADATAVTPTRGGESSEVLQGPYLFPDLRRTRNSAEDQEFVVDRIGDAPSGDGTVVLFRRRLGDQQTGHPIGWHIRSSPEVPPPARETSSYDSDSSPTSDLPRHLMKTVFLENCVREDLRSAERCARENGEVAPCERAIETCVRIARGIIPCVVLSS